MLHKYFQKGPTVTNSCRNVPNTADGTWIFVAPSALGQQKQAGGKGSWYSEGFYFGPARWRGLNTRTPEEGLVEGLPLPPQPRRLRGASRAGCWGGRGLCLQKRAPSSERKDSSRCTARCPRSHVHELRCQKYTENLFFRMALQLAHLLCELMRWAIFQEARQSEAQRETQGYAASNPSSPLKCTPLLVRHSICLLASLGFYEDSVLHVSVQRREGFHITRHCKKKNPNTVIKLLCHPTNVKEERKEGRKWEGKTNRMVRILSKRRGAERCQNLANRTVVPGKVYCQQIFFFFKIQTFPQCWKSPPNILVQHQNILLCELEVFDFPIPFMLTLQSYWNTKLNITICSYWMLQILINVGQCFDNIYI